MDSESRELISERPSMLDSHGHRKMIIPAEVQGRFAGLKTRVQVVLFFIFLLLPWIRIGNEQAVLLDLPNRHFVFFGLHLYAHDAPLIFLLLLAFVSGLALVTALWGRVWCGWACPQTVFIERVYRQIEIWVEGNYIERRRMQTALLSVSIVKKRATKWILFFLVSSLIAHCFIAYWTGSARLLTMIQGRPSENWSYFVWVSAMTGLLLFNFGWFREQFCLIVCPYGKLQSTLLDSHTVTVMYDEKRGEPRKSPAVSRDKQGDCVSCNRCVQVCPTGIDIRQGIQMECIGCTACIDACDEIMRKVKKPEGLIRYKTLTEKKIRWFRPRVLTYATLLVGSIGGLALALGLHSDLRTEFLRGKDNPFQVIDRPEGSWVQNHFVLRVENDGQEPIEVKVEQSVGVEIVLPENPIVLAVHEKKDLPLIVAAPLVRFASHGKLDVDVVLTYGKQLKTQVLPLLGPYRIEK